ncbi:MAG: DNA-processing protein DprA [Bauldia sp.]
MPAPVLLTDDQRLAWLRLIRSDNIGPVTFRALINHFGSATAAIDAVPELARKGGRQIRLRSVEEAEREFAVAHALGARFVALGEAGYPPWLPAIDGAPPLLAVRGSADCLARPAIAIVGSRNASVSGRKFAMQIAAGLGDAGFAVASGLARGIDAAAHTGALAGGTIAVFAGGLDRPYPAENIALAEAIVARGGALISEMPMGHEPRARDFPRRNRLISGISLAVVVVEAALRSGSLITARLAGEQGRLVFAVPGSPLDPRSGGANQLIKDGATLVTSVEDIVAEVRPMLELPAPPSPPIREDGDDGPAFDAPAFDVGDSDRGRILEALGTTPVEIDDIIRFTGLKPGVVRLVLLELDLAGRLEHHGANRVSLIV